MSEDSLEALIRPFRERTEFAEDALEWLRKRGVGAGWNGEKYIAGVETDEGFMACHETPAVQDGEMFLRLLREAVRDVKV